MSTPALGEPLPPVVAALRQALDLICADYEHLVRVEHSFDADEHYDPESDDWPADHGWTTQLWPVAEGVPVQAYFDGVDRDLELRVGHWNSWVGWFTWTDTDLVNIDNAVSEVAGLTAGILAGDIWERRTRRARGCEVIAPDGRLWRAGDGRPPSTFWPRWGLSPVPCRRLPGYRRGDLPAS